MDWAMDYATYIDRTNYDRVDAVRAGIDGITENINGHRVGTGAWEEQAFDSAVPVTQHDNRSTLSTAVDYVACRG